MIVKVHSSFPFRVKSGYVVTHTPGSINIELMWAETKSDQTGLSCLLVYDGPTKEPKELRIAAQKSLTLLFLAFNYVSYDLQLSEFGEAP